MGEALERDADEPTLIWSGEHQAWWKAPANGYTGDILAAGVYTYREAWSRTSHCGPEKRITLQNAEKMLREHLFGLSQLDANSVFNKLLAIGPREPSPAMIKAGGDAIHQLNQVNIEFGPIGYDEYALDAWRVMTAAALPLVLQKNGSQGE